MHRSPGSWAFLAVAIGGVITTGLGCSGPSSSDDAPSPASLEADFSTTILCNEYTNIDDREMYVTSAMNRKLRHYPEFAAFAGFHSVSNCDEARAFAQRYQQYQIEHPRFDALEPRATMPPFPPLPPQPENVVPKIFNGAPPGTESLPHGAIVSLIWNRKVSNFLNVDQGVDQAICSGTFISKNFIATAAHCLERVKIINPSFETSTDGLFGYTNITITWAGPTGSSNPLDGGMRITIPGNNILQVPDDLYKGTPADSDHDFAVLVLNDHVWDPYLPPKVDDGSAMRVSMQPPVIPPGCNRTHPELCQPQGFFGGSGDSATDDFSHIGPDGTRVLNDPATISANLNNKILRIGRDPIVQVNGTTTSTITNPDGTTRTVTTVLENSFVVVPHAQTDGTFCHGDSGGSAYRQTDLGPPRGMVPVLLGVLSRGDPSGFIKNGMLTPCLQADFDMLVARVDTQANQKIADEDLIETTMRNWYANDGFKCTTVFKSGMSNPDYLECWGEPCQDDMDCGMDQYCNQQPLEVALDAKGSVCPICVQLGLPTGASGCDCVWGQCLPKKQL